ncbi:MAG TPA: sigma-70 family RNA polymerase sigma factor [Vicinamibacteria bacterium]
MLDATEMSFGSPWSPAARRPSWGIEASFEQEALPVMRQLYGTAYRITRNAADAEDLVQETYLRAFRAFRGYTAGTNIRAWLFTILYRVRTDQLRRMGRSPQTVAILDDGPAVAPAQAALADGHEEVRRALREVPEHFRAAVLLRDVQEFSYDEIAKILEIPIGTVMSRIHRGRALLRKALTGRGNA